MSTLASLILGLAAGDIGQVTRRLRRTSALYVLLALLALTFYGAGLLSLGFFLEPYFGAAGAALVIAGAALITLLVVLAVNLAVAKTARQRRARDERSLVAQAALTAAPLLIRSGSPFSLIVAGGLGYIIAALLRGRPSGR